MFSKLIVDNIADRIDSKVVEPVIQKASDIVMQAKFWKTLDLDMIYVGSDLKQAAMATIERLSPYDTSSTVKTAAMGIVLHFFDETKLEERKKLD